jgi:hypothetical protein
VKVASGYNGSSVKDHSAARIKVYGERNRVLRAIGFADYKAYLDSDLWKRIRTRVLASDPACVRCGKPATQVHHSRYRKKDLLGKTLNSLFPVRGGCHYRSEFRTDGEKLPPREATWKLVGTSRTPKREGWTKEAAVNRARPDDAKSEAALALADLAKRRRLWKHPPRRR